MDNYISPETAPGCRPTPSSPLQPPPSSHVIRSKSASRGCFPFGSCTGTPVCRRSVLNWGFLMSSNGFVIMEGTVVSGTLMLKTEIIVHNDQVLMNMWGAGTLYDNKGHIVTNAHVVSAYIKVPGEGAPRWLFGKVLANFEGGEECEAEVLSVDVGNDVALLKIPERVIKSDNIPCVLSKDVPGRRAKFFVVGHPNDIPFVVLYGRVSRPSRPLSDFENIPKGDFFNHMDPAMEFLELGGVMAAPGLSGGPLSTEEGSVFGVLNAGIQGIAYGIPAAIIESALDRMFKRSQLGGGVFCHLN